MQDNRENCANLDTMEMTDNCCEPEKNLKFIQLETIRKCEPSYSLHAETQNAPDEIDSLEQKRKIRAIQIEIIPDTDDLKAKLSFENQGLVKSGSFDLGFRCKDNDVSDHLQTFLLTPLNEELTNEDQISVANIWPNTCDTYPEDKDDKIRRMKDEFCDKRKLKEMTQLTESQNADFLLQCDVVSPIALRKNHNNKLEDKMKFRCVFCPKMSDLYQMDVQRWFVRNEDLVRHYLQHLDKKPLSCPTEGCDYSATRKDHIKRHIQNKHSEKKKETEKPKLIKKSQSPQRKKIKCVPIKQIPTST